MVVWGLHYPKKLVDCHDPLWESLMGIPWNPMESPTNLQGSALSNLQRSSLTLRSGALVLTWWGSSEWPLGILGIFRGEDPGSGAT
jgi:hypothetical protein